MPQRADAERIVKALHGARASGDLAGMCRLFENEGRFEITGASVDKPIVVTADGIEEFRPWLAVMVKAFRLYNYTLLSLVVEWPKVVAHWRADIYSKFTGVAVPTELVDLIEIRGDRIVAYREFFVRR